MLTTTAVCDQYAWLYQTSVPEPAGTWDHVLPVDGAYVAVKRIENIDYVMFRGSLTFLDWWDDFDHFALPFDDPLLGPVHPGARDGVIVVEDEINRLIGDHVVVVGHSLGAMHAVLYAGYRIAAGKSVDGLVLFGEPRAGGLKLAQLLQNSVGAQNIQSFRNARPKGTPHDLVTDVPFVMQPDLPYCHAKDPLTDVYREPNPFDPWLLMAWHHFGAYCRAFGCGGVAAQSLQGYQ